MITATRPSYLRVFLAILGRDMFVAGRTFWIVMLQAGLQPLFMLFVFAKVLGSANYVGPEYGRLLLPGVLALTTFVTALQSVAFPLVMEFSVTREIEDRLLAPIPTALVALEKLTMATLRGLLAAAVMYPVGAFVLGDALWNPAGFGGLAIVLVLGAWTGGAIGMNLGTLLPPTRVNVMFGLILTPLLFTGATQYPWPTLSSLRWFQLLTAANPLTYCSEGVRAALVPDIPHMPLWTCVAVLIGCATLFSLTGVKLFLRRAVE